MAAARFLLRLFILSSLFAVCTLAAEDGDGLIFGDSRRRPEIRSRGRSSFGRMARRPNRLHMFQGDHDGRAATTSTTIAITPENPVDNSAPFSPPKQARGVIPVPRIPKPATPPPPPRFPGPHGRPRPIIPEFPSSPDPPRSPKSPKSPKSSDRPESPETGGDGPSSTSDQENPLPRPTSNNFGGSGSNFRSDRQVTSVGNTLNLQHAVLMLALMATGAMAAA
ncbi:uncharacterized protein CIMG_05926 [Coccidioides immitis RS]|uniref:Uncharacterized protein n=3 Tax=Coccidioides immitis TaxID=5501 RepID=J3K729_COCIM|nr:uncharacterized protein CIMG_05926 [Coccidioides immitis RS]EAS30447.3 hypothetical protein CIMG_05926 [Coccidioides immitis RS]TPX23408.1 hypothetical protein DIZ76_012739 [Coccidioides immitis]